MKFKTIITISFCFIILLLVGCKEETTTYNYFPIEYELEDVGGTIKCTNFDFVVCLEKEKGKDFKVLNLADVQLRRDQVEDNAGVVETTLNVVKELIEETEPDLITLSGDQGDGEDKSIKIISDLVDSYNIPWAPIFGNHEHSCTTLSLEEQLALYQSYSNCIMKAGPDEVTDKYSESPRLGNYIINIVERDEESFYIVRTIFMLDTGASHAEYAEEGKRLNPFNYDHLNDKQIEFYKWGVKCSSKYTKDNSYAKSTIIEHMPITAYSFAFAEAFYTTYTAYEYSKIQGASNGFRPIDTYNNSYCWKDGYKDSFGVCHEVIKCAPVDDNIFEILIELGSTDSMIVGHDHKNNFSINYQGIRLTFSLKTGYGSNYEKQSIGGTTITYSGENFKVEHIFK